MSENITKNRIELEKIQSETKLELERISTDGKVRVAWANAVLPFCKWGGLVAMAICGIKISENLGGKTTIINVIANIIDLDNLAYGILSLVCLGFMGVVGYQKKLIDKLQASMGKTDIDVSKGQDKGASS